MPKTPLSRSVLTAGVAALAVLAAGSPGLAAATPATTAAVTPQATTLSSSIGISAGGPMLWEPDAQLGPDLDAIRDAGAGWVRLDIDWSAIEPTRGVQNWSNFDRVVNAARSRGLQVLGIATYTPRWAQDASVPAGTTHGRPASASQFGTFAGQAAAHFAGRITTWEIWNEPNLQGFFAPRVDADFYTSMLTASSTAIHNAVPSATVLGGALAPGVDDPNGSQASPITFLQQMYTRGAKSAMDAVSIHPYSFPALPSDASTASWNTFYRLRNAHDVMVRNGDGGKKIWLTEFGAPTGPAPAAVTEQRQAEIVTDGFASARALDYVGPVFVYQLRDGRTGSGDIEENFGLLRTDRSVKPAYNTVVAEATRGAGGSTPAVGTPSAPQAGPAPSFIDMLLGWFFGFLAMLFG